MDYILVCLYKAKLKSKSVKLKCLTDLLFYSKVIINEIKYSKFRLLIYAARCRYFVLYYVFTPVNR